MFGHDNQDNNDNPGQITLPPAEDLDKDLPGAPQAFTPQSDATITADPVAAPVSDSVRDSAATAAPAIGGAPAAELLDIKQDVLRSLTPLVDHLEQTPEEKFRTTMMMIQASDNHSLIKTAYEAAQKISSEKDRAQALLDIVNEINYFTQNNASA